MFGIARRTLEKVEGRWLNAATLLPVVVQVVLEVEAEVGVEVEVEADDGEGRKIEKVEK